MSGNEIDIMVDCHARPSPRMGLQFPKALEPYGLYFFEEPCWAESMEDIALIQRAVKTPIATGERLIGIHTFRELFEKRAVSVIQPDITHCGGLTEARRIAAMAEDRDRSVIAFQGRPRGCCMRSQQSNLNLPLVIQHFQTGSRLIDDLTPLIFHSSGRVFS